MTEREERRDAQQQDLVEDMEEGASPGAIGAVDGAAAVASAGAVTTGKPDSEIPQDPPDPRTGPD
jgi:hypothetical protein